jgi:hypothetical protein
LPPLNQIFKKSWPDEIERLLIEKLYSPFVPTAVIRHSEHPAAAV